MVGTRMLFTVEILNVSNEDIIDDEKIQTVVDNIVDKMDNSLQNTIYNNHCEENGMDYVEVTLQDFELLDHDSLDAVLTENL